MFRVRFVSLLLVGACLLGIGGAALAAEVDCDAIYCFNAGDFSEEDSLVGICITGLPDTQTGTILLGSRVLHVGDILTVEQVSQMTFSPLLTEEDKEAVVTYLPIYENRVAPATTMTISVFGKKNEAPVAQDSSLETYKNLPNEGLLRANDPEGQPLTYTMVKAPKRGEAVIREDGSFVYTPKKNKVGVDTFTYTVTDPAGNVSREATVTIQILKPKNSAKYADTVGKSCRFAAEWMRNTGIFVGEKLGDAECFFPDRQVSRGEFLTMVIKLLDVPVSGSVANVPADTPDWLKPYLAAAIRSGLTAGIPDSQTGSFMGETPITGAEAAVILQNALDLTVSQQTLESIQTSAEDTEAIPAWAAASLTAMIENGVSFTVNDAMTRAEVAQVLYQISQLSADAPGMAVIRKQK